MLRQAMQSNLNAPICVEGTCYDTEESMPENLRQAFERVLTGTLKARRSLFIGRTARFVPPLKSRIICDNGEFSNVSELPSAQRRFYEEALGAILPGYIAERVAEGEFRLQQRNKLIVACASLLATTSYLWYHGCLTDSRFLFHFVRFLCGLTR